jgi:hypothetical protein
MKRTALALTFILALLFSFAFGMQFYKEAKAEVLGPVVISSSSNVVAIHFPQNQTYDRNSILVDFSVTMGGNAFDFGYSLDGGAVERVENVSKISESGWIPYQTFVFEGNISLSNLTIGEHEITVYEGYHRVRPNERYEVFSYDSVNFSVVPPEQTSFLLIFIAIIASVSVICAGVLVYFKKRKH